MFAVQLALALCAFFICVASFVITPAPPLPQSTASSASKDEFGIELKARLFGQLQPRAGSVACGTWSVDDCCQAQAGCNYPLIYLIKLLLTIIIGGCPAPFSGSTYGTCYTAGGYIGCCTATLANLLSLPVLSAFLILKQSSSYRDGCVAKSVCYPATANSFCDANNGGCISW